MNDIYIVTENDYEWNKICAVFSSYEKAEKYLEKKKNISGLEIETYNIDEELEVWSKR